MVTLFQGLIDLLNSTYPKIVGTYIHLFVFKKYTKAVCKNNNHNISKKFIKMRILYTYKITNLQLTLLKHFLIQLFVLRLILFRIF